ncbi:serine hydrolase domain-containing protein [Streptoalloteichus hindustanus]|uniref:D-alanyl-D-alanine carboxypeptidase n=1 Tax=Streptoalloteichus hindustanus TaxID=2017 RepID=A0A1M5DP15_STRHI|nr:serine hydrolase domain-containing protein [Streptoalloteichus hindustanus]SHF68636.1 D-alanyl-D-alanine carboxypeptidase [Streptoalloteichus hindustanus]
MRLGMRRFTTAVVAATVAVGLFGPTALAAPETATAPEVRAQHDQDRAALRKAMSELVSSGAAGVQVRVHDEQGDWTGSSGVRELPTDERVPTNGRFRIGSITKTFVSTVVLQLVGEGRIGLDDPVARHLPRFGLDQRITVRMLLQHTSGLFNYTGDRTADGKFDPGIPLLGKEFLNWRYHTYQPDELVRFALSKPARFEPGARWQYSNTNYALAGLLIEKITGTPYARQVERRILRPLRLWETSLPGTAVDIPGPHAHGYFPYTENGKVHAVDITRHNVSWANAAGEIISTTRDLDRFVSALLGGTLLRPELLAVMRETRPIGDEMGYGLGLMTLDKGPACGGTMFGHDGGVPGYRSYLLSNADRSKRLELSVTVGAVNVDDLDAAMKFGNAIVAVVVTALCGGPAPSTHTASPLAALPSMRF